MKLAYYIKDSRLELDPRVLALLAELGAAGFDVAPARVPEDVPDGTEMLLSFGGDGTYLSAAALATALDLPVLGVNFGRLGFLSGHKPEEVVAALVNKDYSVQKRGMLRAEGWCAADGPQLALNEVCVMRQGAAMLGIDVSIDSKPLPTYWADGLLVATSSGSTAYSLSAGGPICLPDARVLIVAPVAPHNLNVRPLVVPDSADIKISFQSREDELRLTVDNRGYVVPATSQIRVKAAPGALKRVELGGSSFIEALRARLLWGGDVRNLNH